MLNVVLLVIVLAAGMAGVSALHRISRRSAPQAYRSAP
ncbi:hypothetical protein SAMN04490239_1215 [Rhodococcus koreensis]|uniref:Uncharacterized protein n=1 Tax=Rhodococcus koreensis TaxID=99653 RepID=A0A1H4LCV4_9NOCA|nr:hypothetical protein SAMN04490239_1215 [Rhodococcus koreensis]